MIKSIPGSKISLVVADDHPLFMAGIISVLKDIPEFKILKETGDGESALKLILELKPDIAILDIKMPGLSGLQIAKNLMGKSISTKIILLTMFKDQKMFLEALDNGVKGYVLKDALVQDINIAIKAVYDGQYYLSPELSGILVDNYRKKDIPAFANEILEKLTPAELKILRLIAELRSNSEIAEKLFISKRTVENHRVNISRKLNLEGTNSLLKFAIKNKFYF